MRHRKSWIALLLLALFLGGCSARSASEAAEAKPDDLSQIEPKGKVYYTYFDTVSYVYDYAGDSAERFDDRSAEVSHILSAYHRLFDIYHEYSGINNFCTLNKAAGQDAVEVDPRLIDFLECAVEMYEQTDGEMNVMLGSVLTLWHNCREAAEKDPSSASIPSAEELEEAYRHTDISLLEIDREHHTVRIADPDASIDVGALGKGYATERAAEYLEEEGAAGYVLNIGGNIRCIGDRPDVSGWVTAIRKPDNASDDLDCRIRIRDTACVTSGIYERYFTVHGVRYHHIIDRDTLMPAAYYDSLTVITRDSALADALSTALFCMPWEESKELAEKIGGVDVLWIFPNGEQRSTPGFADRIVEQSNS
ncbi:MAG: FAD:protein FMN transferase [Clostridia bacterium]|nr:FAD:protein FMN transferase [Clostridia bacterium]